MTVRKDIIEQFEAQIHALDFDGKEVEWEGIESSPRLKAGDSQLRKPVGLKPALFNSTAYLNLDLV